MKKSIIYLAISLAWFTNVNAKDNFGSQMSTASTEEVTAQKNSFHLDIYNIGKRNLAPVEDQIPFNPETVILNFNQKTILEIISDNNKIIENTSEMNEELLFIEKPIEQTIEDDNKIIENANDTASTQPLYIERSIEEVILENNTIIENNKPNVVFPLDFEAINNSQLYFEKQILKL